jgi:hypothetical protein
MNEELRYKDENGNHRPLKKGEKLVKLLAYMKFTNKNNLSDKKIAVVTGSSKGIGRAIAITLANTHSYSGIVTNSRDLGDAQTLRGQISSINAIITLAFLFTLILCFTSI